MDTIILASSTSLAAWMGLIAKFDQTPNALSDKESQNIFKSDGSPKFENVILAIQSYKDLWAICLQRGWNKKNSHNCLMVKYLNNIIAYHAFAGNKMIVRFEDVLADHQQEGQKISSFINMEGFQEVQKPKFKKLEYELESELRLKIDDLYRKRLGGLYSYLARYADNALP